MQKKLGLGKSAGARERSMFRRRVISVTVISVIVLAAATLCFLLMSPSFNITNVICEGNENISNAALLETASVQSGHNIFLTSLREAKSRVENLEYVSSAKLERRLPSTVCITVTEEQPSAYFSIGSQLALTDADGVVLDVVSSTLSAEEIVNLKIPKDEEPEPSPTAEPVASEEPDDKIWGYDDDGDPIYKVNGGHYEFDDDGNRFFVDDSAAESAAPEESPEAEAQPQTLTEIKYDELPKTSEGILIYPAPVVTGINLSSFKKGNKVKSGETEKLDTTLGIVAALKHSNMIRQTTKIDVENLSDIRIYIESRLEILFGSAEDIDYKVKFVASVINENLSKYEHAVLDFRDSKLYVRSDDPTPLRKSSPPPSAEPSDDADEEDEDSESTSEYDDDSGDESEEESPEPKSSPAADEE